MFYSSRLKQFIQLLVYIHAHNKIAVVLWNYECTCCLHVVLILPVGESAYIGYSAGRCHHLHEIFVIIRVFLNFLCCFYVRYYDWIVC
jgi:hypothetical protein